MSDLEYLSGLIDNHLNAHNLNGEPKLWKIKESALDGRGIFASRDIQTGETIFVDYPLLIGPRAGTNVKYLCVVCAKTINLKPCSKHCGLPVCSLHCEMSSVHLKECELIRSWNKNGNICGVSSDLFRSLTPLRAFLLNKNLKNLLTTLACHMGKIHGFEVELVKKYLNLSTTDEEYMKIACSVLDSNAYETAVNNEKVNSIMRGLYPLSSLLNHCCVPNTTNLFDAKQRMIVKATVPIPKDSEIFATYTSILWATASRRHHLATTKHFWCLCDRCKDPREKGACLSGLKCTTENCRGVLYPLQPLKNGTRWQCDVCNLLVPSKTVGMVQSALGSLLKTLDISDVEQLISLIRDRVENVVPPRNQIAVDLKLRVVWMLGQPDKSPWCNISLENLNFKAKWCKEILDILSQLNMGQCKIRGLILSELYKCLHEASSRTQITENNIDMIHAHLQDIDKILKEATDILGDDVTILSEINPFL